MLHVERLEEVADGGGRWEGVAEQGGQRLILAERGEVLTPVPAAHPQGDQTLDELRGLQSPLPLLDRHRGIDRGGHPELAEQLDHQRDPGAAGDQRGSMASSISNGNRGVSGIAFLPVGACTQWVNASKHDAIPAGRKECRSPGDSQRGSSS